MSDLGPGLLAGTRRCTNTSCRVETFVGTSVLPLSACPVCLMPGTPT